MGKEDLDADDRNRILLDLLPELYQAPGDANLWSAFIETLTMRTGAVQGLFVHHDTRDQRTDLASGFNLDLEWAVAYQSYFQFKNPYINVAPWELPKRGTHGLLEELIPDKEVQKTEFYHDYVLPQGVTVTNAIRMTPFQSEDSFTSIALHRAIGSSDKGLDKALWLCGELMPHLQIALQMHNRIVSLENQVQSLMGTMDRLSFWVS